MNSTATSYVLTEPAQGKSMEALVLTHHHVLDLIRGCGRDRFMDVMIDRLRHAFVSVGQASGAVPPRDGFSPYGNDEGVIEWMPYRESGTAVTVKLVSYSRPIRGFRRYLPSTRPWHGLTMTPAAA